MLTLTRIPGADWLPAGGVAEVVLAERGDSLPTPVGLVRLLVTDADRRIFCVPRSGGRDGLDLPTVAVGDSTPAEAVRLLTAQVLGGPAATDLVGWVRNVVPPDTAYEWPSPIAHFVVVRPTEPGHTPVVDGAWLDRSRAASELADRHWWPLAVVDRAAVFDGQPGE